MTNDAIVVNLHEAVQIARKKYNHTRKGVPNPRKKPRRIINCACGCGATLETPDKYCKERRYIKGHNTRKSQKTKCQDCEGIATCDPWECQNEQNAN
jgi:hypothetical protein